MKKNDLALIVLITALAAAVSFFLSNAIFGDPGKKDQKVEIIGKITSEFKPLDPRFFNSTALNPTKDITIGDETNTNSFFQEQQR